MDGTKLLQERLKDKRSKRIVFLSHCLLNENTRYLGGACTGGCVKAVVEECLNDDLGIVQMPCPEQQAWGGVNKRWFLLAFGIRGTLLYSARSILLPLFILHTKLVYRRTAGAVADQINDYLASGYNVVGVVGIDGSPSCGVNATLDIRKSFDLTAGLNVGTVTVDQMNAVIRESLIGGRGLFTAMLQDELKKRSLIVPYQAHDLIAEIRGTAFGEEAQPSKNTQRRSTSA